MSINKVVISGNLTREPDVRSTQSGMNILTFGMAVNDRRRNPQTGEWEDYANFIDCVLFGNRADYLSRTMHKGMRVVVDGKLRYSSWERDGQRRSKLEVVVEDVDFISPRQQQGGGGGYAQPQQGGYGMQQGGYEQPQQGYQQNPGPAYSVPAQQNPPMQAPQAYAQPQPVQQPRPVAQPQPQQAASASAPRQESPAPTPAPSTSSDVVTTPPETDVYDNEIPF